MQRLGFLSFILISVSIAYFTIDKSYTNHQIFNLRLIRFILAVASGISLSSGGTVLQTIFLNPLAEPYIVGVTGGALTGYSIAVLLGFYSFKILALFAFAGSLVVMAGIYAFSTRKGVLDLKSLLLGGIILNFFSFSGVLLIMTLKRQGIERMLYLLWGSFGVILTHGELVFSMIGIALIFTVFAIFILYHRAFDALSLGEDEAYSMGVDVDFMRKLTFVLTSASTGVLISIVGAIGFVGLISPHIARIIGYRKHAGILVASAVVGTTLLLLSDMASRYLFPVEFPVGVITSLIGVPFFFYILGKNGY